MTHKERLALFRPYIANQLTEKGSSAKDIIDILKHARMMSDDEVKAKLYTAVENVDNVRLARFLVEKDFGGSRVVWFTQKRGAYRTICPKCHLAVKLKKVALTASRGTCEKCKAKWLVSWFGGIMTIKKD